MYQSEKEHVLQFKINPSINESEKQVKQQITKTDTIWHIPRHSLV